MVIKRENFELTSQMQVGHIFLKWRMENFSLWPTVVGQAIQTEHFTSSSCTFVVLFYPKLYRNNGDEVIGIFLKSVSLDGEKRVIFKVSIRDKNDADFLCDTTEFVFTGESNSFGFNSLMRRQELQEKRELLLHNDLLILYCEITVIGDMQLGQVIPAVEPSARKSPTSINCLDMLSRNLGALYKSRKLCDGILKTPLGEFPVHTVILSARSPVLAKMFEKTAGKAIVLKSKNAESEDVEDFIRFLYTGKIDNITMSSAVPLLYLADKYGVEELKSKCVDFISIRMCVHNFFYFAMMADKNNREYLMKPVKEFFADNFQDILFTGDWITLTEERPELAAEIKKSCTSES